MSLKKTKVNLIFRNPEAGFSIEGVFKDLYQSDDTEFEFRVCHAPRRRAGIVDLLINMVWAIRLPKADIYHITGDLHYCIIPLIFKPTVLTIHDTVLLDHCKKTIKRWIYFIFWFFLPCLFARRVICISETTRESLKQLLPFIPIDVIHNAVPLRYNYWPKPWSEGKPIVLHIGTSWNKNLSNVIDALRGMECFLRIIGQLDNTALRQLSDAGLDYSNTWNLTDEQIVNEYRQCDLVSFPSIYEGFGMPIIEAQSVGRVVVTSCFKPMTEIAGQGACYVNPNDVQSIRFGFMRCLSDSSYREYLLEKANENVLRFNFLSMRNAYARIYRSLLRGS